ncbi:hypothetical protein GE21DRAFT_1219573 [Neurospora crassa]|nr:hypothetical protein GE21DRAFT_1219573 [Neurospora crassa]
MGVIDNVKELERNGQVRAILRALKRRNFAGKNGLHNVRYHRLSRPTILAFWVYVGNGVGVRRVTLILILWLPFLTVILYSVSVLRMLNLKSMVTSRLPSFIML